MIRFLQQLSCKNTRFAPTVKLAVTLTVGKIKQFLYQIKKARVHRKTSIQKRSYTIILFSPLNSIHTMCDFINYGTLKLKRKYVWSDWQFIVYEK